MAANVLAGFTTGLVGGLAGWIAMTVSGGAPGFVPAMVGVVIGAGLWAVTLMAVGAVLFPLQRSRRGRVPALVCTGAVVAPLIAMRATALFIRLFTGAWPDLSSVTLFTSDPSQFFHAATVGYASRMVQVAVFSVGVGILVAWGVGALATRFESVRGSRLLVAGLGAVVLAGLVTGPARQGPVVRAALDAAPELVMLRSVVRPKEPLGASPQTPVTIQPGPPLAAELEWRAAVDERGAGGPDVILLLLESVSAGHVGYQGYPRPVTPNLDALASRSVRFDRARATSSLSSYAQMSVLSSLHPRRTSHLNTFQQLDYPRVLFHDVFHALGYDTATISSQNENWGGMRRFEDTGTPTTFHDATDFPGPLMGSGENRKVPDHRTVEVALAWLEQPRTRPTALYINLQRTHHPYEPVADWEGPFQPADPDPNRFGFLSWPIEERDEVVNRYDNALVYVDEQIGAIARWLNERGRLEDTLWIIAPDHGELFNEYGQVTHGKTLYDAELRVPLLVHWPARLEPTVIEEPVSLLDVVPTIVDLVDAPQHPAFQGQPLLGDAGREDRAVFMTIQGLVNMDAVVCEPWKLTADFNAGEVHLYDLPVDPREEHDLYAPTHPAAAALEPLLVSFILAQKEYHEGDPAVRAERYAPRMPRCPTIP